MMHIGTWLEVVAPNSCEVIEVSLIIMYIKNVHVSLLKVFNRLCCTCVIVCHFG